MTTVQFIASMESYYCAYTNDHRKAVVASVVEKLHPDLRRPLANEIMRTLSTGWNRAPDWADVDKALNSAAMEGIISDVKYAERQRLREEQYA